MSPPSRWRRSKHSRRAASRASCWSQPAFVRSSAIRHRPCRIIRRRDRLLRPYLFEGGNDARIFVAPIEACPRQQLDVLALDARRHAEAVEFNLMEPLRSRRSDLDRLAELGRDPARKRRRRILTSARPTGLDGLSGRTLSNTRHVWFPVVALSVRPTRRTERRPRSGAARWAAAIVPTLQGSDHMTQTG